jgi:hypothetical protein
MTRINRTTLRLGLALFAVLGGLAPSTTHAQPYTFDATEAAYDTTYALNPVNLSGTAVTRTGQPIANATVTVVAWGAGAANANRTATTNATGAFTIAGLSRRSALLEITAPGYYTEIIPVDLQRPTAETSTSAGAVTMTQKQAGRVRVLFGGDTMFGRRFVDADGDGIEGEAVDLLRPATRAADAQAILSFVRGVVSSADYSIVNLESPVTSDPSTPHPYKDYTFYSYPETLSALTYAGVDGVDLANNHMFDYLSDGIADTMSHVSNAGLDWAGIGTDESVAEATTIFRTLNGVPLSMLGFSEMVSDGSTDANYLLVARDPTKAGALEASSTNLSAFTSAEVGRFILPMVHGGVEYTDYPTNSMRSRFVSLVQGGAGLVVAHHPHTAQGIGLVSSKFVMMSLGNFVFDQDVLETFNSYLAIADIDVLPGGGYDVARLELVPFHIDNYVPKLLAGEPLARAGRAIAHLSTTLSATPSGSSIADGLTGAVVITSGSRILALRSSSQYTTATSTQTVNAAVSSKATGPIEFTRLGPSDSLATIKTNASATAEYGREILLSGDFEDADVDGDFSEGSAWDQSGARYVENSLVRSGIGAVVLLRSSTNTADASLFNKNRVSFPGGSKLTVTGYVRGENAGVFKLTTRLYDDAGATLSTTDSYTKTAGTYGWTKFTVNLTAASNATSVRFYLKESPPLAGEGRVYVDDLDLVRWEGSSTAALSGIQLAAPNNWDYVRFTSVATGVSTLGVTLTRRSFTAN